MPYKLINIFKALVLTCFLFTTICLWQIHSLWTRTTPLRNYLFGKETTIPAYDALFANKPIPNLGPSVQRGRSIIDINEWKSDDFCLSTLQDVYWHPLFPKYPSKHHQQQSLDQLSIWTKRIAIRRVMLLICPPTPGQYQFLISFEGGFGLFLTEWGSEEVNENRNSLYQFLFDDGFTDKKRSVTSGWIVLDSNKAYKIDLIHWMKSNGSIGMSWRTPMLNFTTINSDLVCSPSDTNMPLDATHVMPDAAYTSERQKSLETPLYWFYTREPRTLRDFNTTLRACNYTPSYLIRDEVAKYTGWLKVMEGKYWPYYPLLKKDLDKVLLGNSIARQIASEVFGSLNQGRWRNYKMDNVIFVEQNNETTTGHRYFVEIDVTDTITNQTIRVSDHVYKPGNSSPICLPNGHIWSRDVDVNVVFTTSNVNKRWTLFMLDSIAGIVSITGDRNVKVGIAAYGLENIDLEHELTKRNLQGTVLRLAGTFNKVRALNAIVRSVSDPDSLIFTLDLHLELPLHIFDQVRKNTIPGRTVFAPVLVRLPCGKHLEYTDPGDSFWVLNGFGVIGVYKKDWDIIGGMNEELFGTKWGGEDWELVDRVISQGYEVIRRRLSGFYHVYHSRKNGKWYE